MINPIQALSLNILGDHLLFPALYQTFCFVYIHFQFVQYNLVYSSKPEADSQSNTTPSTSRDLTFFFIIQFFYSFILCYQVMLVASGKIYKVRIQANSKLYTKWDRRRVSNKSFLHFGYPDSKSCKYGYT